MASLYTYMLTLLIYLITRSAGCEDVPEFQFPCYVDVCTFPRQFCNSDQHERRCSPCSRSICRGDRIPVACKYICRKYNEPITPSPAPTTMKIPQTAASQYKGSEDLMSLYLIMAYSAVVCTLLVIILLIFIGYYILRKKQKLDKGKTLKSIAYRPSTGDNTEVREQLLERQPETSAQCRNHEHKLRLGSDVHSPPSYHTNDPLTIVTSHGGDRSPSDSETSIPDTHILSAPTRPTTKTTSTQAEGQVASMSQLNSRYRTNATADGAGEFHEKAWSMGHTKTCANDTATRDMMSCDDEEETTLKS